MKLYLNLGCGHRCHPAWTNIDIVPRRPGVIQHDLSRGIPFADAYCDVVYHSTALEHMRRADAKAFLRECCRVLKPGGIIRVAVPDLERICRLYLKKLEAAANGDVAAAWDYEWLLLELYDQSVRERTGGDMLAYMRQHPLPNETFVLERVGEEGRELMHFLGQSSSDNALRRAGRLGKRFLAGVQQWIVASVAGPKTARALEIGRFRLSGEVHHWMYDRYSLAQTLISAGYHQPILQTAVSSQIPNWPSYNLDTLPDGTVIKPDLLYMEARKPETR